jgi:restriction endonuclease S subunit
MQTLKLTNKYETYPEYKDSGVEWLGKIPKGWDKRKIKTFSKTLAGGTPSTDNLLYWEGGTIPWLPSGMVHNNVINNNTHEKYITELGLKESATKIIPKESTLVALTGATCANIAYLTFQATANQSVVAIVNNKKISLSKYVYYALLANRQQILTKRTGGAQSGINEQDVKNLVITFPQIELQEKISKYLDEKIHLIDQMMERKEIQIELLKEKKTSFINDAINNINGNKEKLKYIAGEENIKNELLSSDDTYIGLENIESNTGKYIPSLENMSPESVSKVFYKDNVLFGKLRPYLAKVYSSEFGGICSGEFLVLKPKKEKMISRFIF